MIRLAVNGACGKMGRRIVALAHESQLFEIAGAADAAGHELLGRDAGAIAGIGEIGVEITDKLAKVVDVVIDFSTPSSSCACAQHCADHKLPVLIGTTGLDDEQKGIVAQAAKKTAVLAAANTSLGMNLLFKLVGQVALALGDGYDVEITETHHRFKADAPSGTALELARGVATAKDWPFDDCLVHGRAPKQGPRKDGTIGMHAIRAGDTVGDHSVIFAALGETVELRHCAHTRDTFVRGALRAAQWLVGRPCGSYTMAEVLGL